VVSNVNSQYTKSSSNDMNRTFKIFLRCAGEIAVADMASKGQADAGFDLEARKRRHRRKGERMTENRGFCSPRGKKRRDPKEVEECKRRRSHKRAVVYIVRSSRFSGSTI